jgi:hypothetical protein
VTLLDGKQRVAEDVFGWSRKAVELGIHEHQTGIACVNDISARAKPRTEDKHPKLYRQDYRLRTVAKSKVQKKPTKPMPSSKTSDM